MIIILVTSSDMKSLSAKTYRPPTGRRTSIPSCWAARKSLTREDMMMFTPTLNMHAMGTATRRMTVVFQFGK